MQFVTVRDNKRFQYAYKKGKNFVSPVLVTYILKNNVGYNRYGITASKKVGCAVKRNRARRIIKEAFYHLSPKLAKGYDFIFVARVKTTFIHQGSLEKAMQNHLKSAGLLELE